MKVRDRWDRFAAQDAAALFVVHDTPERTRRLLLRDVGELPFPVLVDRGRRTYAAWGLRRAPWWRVWLDPKVWRQYARLLLRGQRLRGAGEDTLQLGGDFLVDADGTVVYARPQHRDDRPPVAELLRRLEAR